MTIVKKVGANQRHIPARADAVADPRVQLAVRRNHRHRQLAHDANLLFYASDEAKEGREAYRNKRTPDFSQFPKRP